MINNSKTDFTVDKHHNTIQVKREFIASKKQVWAAWTEPDLLDQWWAPKPYRTETKSMDFREGGMWLYAMVSPEKKKQWCKANYKAVDPLQSFSYSDAFCDDNGVENDQKPTSYWTITFSENNGFTTVNITIKHDSLEDVEKLIEMGFKQGFLMALENLDNMLSGE
jgi:uncharacterized protein YndB with AHSA1/START domain